MYPIVEQFIAARKKADDDYNSAVRAVQTERDNAIATARAEGAVRAASAKYSQPQVHYHPTAAYTYTTGGGWIDNGGYTYQPPPPPPLTDLAADDAIRAARDAYYRSVNVADEARRQAHQQAWALLDTSDDPLVKYIHAHCHGYPDHAVRILEILPADLPAMQEVALKGGWCDVFGGFVAGAVRQKVLVDPRSPQRRKLEKALLDADLYSDTRMQLLALVDAEVKMAVKRALTAERKAVREGAAKTTTAKAPKAVTPQAVTA
jgi:hypothetical protein